jgi:hypothetical protein
MTGTAASIKQGYYLGDPSPSRAAVTPEGKALPHRRLGTRRRF